MNNNNQTSKTQTQPSNIPLNLPSKTTGCFGENIPILLWNGTTKMSQDIRIGDILVGDDGTQRIVHQSCSGEDELYEIQQSNGINYIVNGKHNLVLKYKGDAIQSWKKYNKLNISVEHFLLVPQIHRNELMGLKCVNGQFIESPIQVIYIGKGNYYSWMVDKNNTFLLEDYTVVKN